MAKVSSLKDDEAEKVMPIRIPQINQANHRMNHKGPQENNQPPEHQPSLVLQHQGAIE